MNAILPDVSRLPERYKRELQRGEHVRTQLAILRQHRIKEAADQLDYRHIEGIGTRVMCIDPELALRCRMKDGMNCLHDPDYIRVLLRDNPFLRIRCAPAKTTLRVQRLKKAVRPVGDFKEKSSAPGAGEGAQLIPATPFLSGHAVPGARSGALLPSSGSQLSTLNSQREALPTP